MVPSETPHADEGRTDGPGRNDAHVAPGEAVRWTVLEPWIEGVEDGLVALANREDIGDVGDVGDDRIRIDGENAPDRSSTGKKTALQRPVPRRQPCNLNSSQSPGWWCGRATEARQREHHDGEGIGRVRAVRLRVSQHGKQIQVFMTRSRPPVREDQRQWVRCLHRVHHLPIHVDAQVLQDIE